jgi:hypothetical protein
MHAIGGVFGRKNPGMDAGKGKWLIHSVFKEEQVYVSNRQQQPVFDRGSTQFDREHESVATVG